MRKRTRLGGLVALVCVVVLALGVTSAFGHGGPGRGGLFGKSSQKVDLLTPAAKTLGVSVDTLKKAILDVANAKIDKAVEDEKIDEDDAADLKDDLAANPQLAIPFTSATGVAKKLGITKAKLDDAFRSARKAAYLAKIDKAVADDTIDEDTAADLKADLEDADLPGYKQSLAFRGGFGGSGGLLGGGFGRH